MHEPATSDYRAQLVRLRQDAETSFDRTIVLLSGGGLGVSFAFVRDFLGGSAVAPEWLVAAWICWVASLASVLASHYCSARAMDAAIRQVDSDLYDRTHVGGRFAAATRWLNAIAGGFFIVGAVLMSVFATINLN